MLLPAYSTSSFAFAEVEPPLPPPTKPALEAIAPPAAALATKEMIELTICPPGGRRPGRWRANS
jgi:hypothetical protein